MTLMLDAQVSDVRDLTRKAGIKPTVTRTQLGDALLTQIAPGERTYVAEADRPQAEPARPSGGGGNRGGNGGGGGRRRGGNGGGGAPKSSTGGGGRRQPAKSGGGTHSASSFSSARRGR